MGKKMEEVENQGTVSAKSKMAKETGYTGLTLLSRLTYLNGFNPFTDMVHDVMHLVLLNCCKKLFSRYFEDEDLLDTREFNERLEGFPFTPGMLKFVSSVIVFSQSRVITLNSKLDRIFLYIKMYSK